MTDPAIDGTADSQPSQQTPSEGGTPPKGTTTPSVETTPAQKPDGPPPDHPRFTEIYGKMKDFERKTQEQDDTINALREHNKSLAESIDTVTDQFSQASRPDPAENPEEFAKWMEDKVTRDIKREMSTNQTPTPTQTPSAQPSQVDYNRDVQIAIMEAVHDDYNDVIDQVKGDIENDAVLRNQIYSSPNPPKTAYEYGIRKRNAQATTNSQGYVEGGSVGGAPPNPNGGATQAQIDMANKLGISPEAYMKQATYINGRNR